jgi:hypothetical protein
VFSAGLKELIFHGWSKEPKERPPIPEFKSVLKTMLTAKEKEEEDTKATENTNSQENIFSNQREVKLDYQEKWNEILESGKSEAVYNSPTEEATELLINKETGSLKNVYGSG